MTKDAPAPETTAEPTAAEEPAEPQPVTASFTATIAFTGQPSDIPTAEALVPIIHEAVRGRTAFHQSVHADAVTVAVKAT